MLSYCIVMAVICGITTAICCAQEGGPSEEMFSFVNPFVIYRHVKVNYLGAIVLSVIFHAVFPYIAAGYWIYKLCTIGRK